MNQPPGDRRQQPQRLGHEVGHEREYHEHARVVGRLSDEEGEDEPQDEKADQGKQVPGVRAPPDGPDQHRRRPQPEQRSG